MAVWAFPPGLGQASFSAFPYMARLLGLGACVLPPPSRPLAAVQEPPLLTWDSACHRSQASTWGLCSHQLYTLAALAHGAA